MRLITLTNIVYIVLSVVIVSVAGFIFYQNVNSIIDEEFTESLLNKKEETILYIDKYHALPPENNTAEFIHISPVKIKGNETVIDSLIYNEAEQEDCPYRIFTFYVSFQHQYYQVTVSKSLLEQEDLIESLFFSFAMILIILIFTLLIFNYLFSKIIWKPFFILLSEIKNFKSDLGKGIRQNETIVSEFNQLNLALCEMSDKIIADFRNLKTFTENASHEMQTPLAVMQSKVESLLQNSDLNEKQVDDLGEINHTILKLRNMNQTLLLIAKIENNQYKVEKSILLEPIIQRKVSLFDDIIKMKKIQIELQLADIATNFHPDLAEILITNLIHNAVKFTPNSGKIFIYLNESKFTISNTGEPFKKEFSKLLLRFNKENDAADSPGLGLSIIESIANAHAYHFNYSYENGLHHFSLLFIK